MKTIISNTVVDVIIAATFFGVISLKAKLEYTEAVGVSLTIATIAILLATVSIVALVPNRVKS